MNLRNRNTQPRVNRWLMRVFGLLLSIGASSAMAAVVQLNSTGGTTTTDGLRIYIEDTSKIQVTVNVTKSYGLR